MNEAQKMQMEILNKVSDVNLAVLRLLEYLNAPHYVGNATRISQAEIEKIIKPGREL